MKRYLLLILQFLSLSAQAQAFSDEKLSAINFVKRLYHSSPFEGVKKIEGNDANYCIVAVSYVNVSNDSGLAQVSQAQIKAQLLAEQGFAEPCVKFEMIGHIEKSNQSTYLFLCTTLDEFVNDLLKKNLLNGAKIISAPGNKYIVSSVSLENAKYSSPEMCDKAASMKAKQFVNVLINGSVITSDQIIRTDETDSKTEITSTEVVREHAMGFIQGLELLFSKNIIPNKTTYVYFAKL